MRALTPKRALAFQLAVMGTLVALAVIFPGRFVAVLRSRPELYMHAKLLHILSATLFFGNVVIGTMWETKSLLSKRLEIIRHTYETVEWLDAFFTAPLVLTAVSTGLVLGTLLGGVFSMGWLSVAFVLFCLSGLVWVVLDIPSQKRVRALFAELPKEPAVAPDELLGLLRGRLKLNLATIVPLLIVFFLMVHKPQLPLP